MSLVVIEDVESEGEMADSSTQKETTPATDATTEVTAAESSDEELDPKPKKQYPTLSSVLETHKGVEFSVEERKSVLSKQDKQDFANGEVPAAFAHHDFRMNDARKVFYRCWYEYCAAIAAWESRNPEKKAEAEQATAEKRARTKAKKRAQPEPTEETSKQAEVAAGGVPRERVKRVRALIRDFEDHMMELI